MNDDLRRVRRELRAWTGRPPARSPRIARQRVLARIETRRTARNTGWLLVAATSIGVAVLAVGLLVREPETASESPVTMAALEPPASVEASAGAPGLLVYQLASGTNLYFALAATTPINDTTTEGNR